jgi:hypothetical protein
MNVRIRSCFSACCGIALAAIVAASGCSAPTATLDLLTVARKGVQFARLREQQQHADARQRFNELAASLDQAFDADVRLAASGQLRNAGGQAVSLTPEWVISARKGYAAARDAVASQARTAETQHAMSMDNLDAADEALDMASQLTVRQWQISEQVRQTLINSQRRLLHE